MSKVRNRYFVCYDVSDPQRLAQTYKKMRGYGDPIQYSVFVCDLSPKEMLLMKSDLMELINVSEDRILIINSGSAEKTTKGNIITVGMSLEDAKESAIVI